jgi:hypothetical protein
MGQSGVDVRLIGTALKLLKLSVECKYQESWAVHQWMAQARENIIKDTDWLLVAKRNRMKPVVFMDFEAFIQLLAIVVHYRIPMLSTKDQMVLESFCKPKSRLVKRKPEDKPKSRLVRRT